MKKDRLDTHNTARLPWEMPPHTREADIAGRIALLEEVRVQLVELDSKEQ